MADKNNTITADREQFSSKWGFILACVGSAVGMANVWAFPYRVAQYGGAGYVIPYLLLAVVLGLLGVAAEIAFGRWGKSGPIGTFRKALQSRGKSGKLGAGLGTIPVLGSFAIAAGYAIIIGWALRYFVGSVSGKMFEAENYGAYFGEITGNFGSVGWHMLAMAFAVIIMVAGVVQGIERINKIMMPLFFVLLAYMVVRVAMMDGTAAGYTFLLVPDWSALLDGRTWVYALGQCFFSLSLAGSGTLVYGSYTSEKENPFSCSFYIVLLDTVSALMATLVIIPAVFAFGIDPQSGPPLAFITLPGIFAEMAGGRLFSCIFFLALIFAAVPSLVNLLETPIEAVMSNLHLDRKKASFLVIGAAALCGLFLENGNVVGTWMDIVSIYVVPVGALISAIIFFWVMGKDFAREQVQIGQSKLVGSWFVPMGRYLFCGVTVAVIILGVVLGGI